MNLPSFLEIKRESFNTWDESYTCALGKLSNGDNEVEVTGIKVTREYHYHQKLLHLGYYHFVKFEDLISNPKKRSKVFQLF